MSGELRIHPKAIMCSAEVLTPETRQKIEKAFGFEPFNLYAATETGPMAAECEEHNGLHIFEDNVIVESVDRNYNPVQNGEFGAKILVTVLSSRTVPLIRYEVSDSICISERQCPCGRNLHLMEDIQGRAEEFLTLKGSHGQPVLVHPRLFYDFFEPLSVEGWQISYKSQELTVSLMRGTGGVNNQDLVERLKAALSKAGAQPPPIKLQDTEKLIRGTTGKVKLLDYDRSL